MIAHVDADSFFASVLQRKHPHLRGKALFALGMGGGCIIAASYEAKAFGVKTGMPVREARRLCPHAVEMPSDFRETSIASKQIAAILGDECPLIQAFSIDEWFLDLRSLVGGVPQDLETWARTIQRRIRSFTDLSVSIGVGPSKLLAKMAGEYHKPTGVMVIRDTSDIEPFLRDRPAAAIPGIGRKRTQAADAHGWKTAWDFAMANQQGVKMLFGKQGPELQRELLGECLSSVSIESPPPKSISRARAFRATRDTSFLWAQIVHHAQYVILRMREQALGCHGITVWMRDSEFHHRGASARLPQLLDTEEALLPFLRSCFDEMMAHPIRCNQTGLFLWSLAPMHARQSSLFEDQMKPESDQRLQQSLDAIRKRHGREIIGRGAAIAAHGDSRPMLALSLYGES